MAANVHHHEDDYQPDDCQAVARVAHCHASRVPGSDRSPIGSIVTGSGVACVRACADLRLASCPRSRIEREIDDVDRQIDEHEPDGDDEHRSLHHGDIARQDPLVERVTHSRPGEDVLGEDRASEQETDLQTGDRDDRRQRVSQRVARGSPSAPAAHWPAPP